MYKASGNNPTTLGLDAQPTGQAGLWLLGFGGQLIGEDGAPTLDNPNNTKALEVLKQLTDAQGGYAKVKSFTDSFDFFGDKNQFVKDQVGAEVVPQWFVNVLTPYVKEVEISAVPFKDSSGKPFTVASGSAFVVPDRGEEPGRGLRLDAQADLAGRLDGRRSGPGQDHRQDAGRDQHRSVHRFARRRPGDPDAVRQAQQQRRFDEAIATYYDVVAQGKSFGASPAGQQIQTELQNAVASALLGSKAPDAALKDAQTAAMRAYNQAR